MTMKPDKKETSLALRAQELKTKLRDIKERIELLRGYL